jgi:two-component system chemotaxis response regulator CheY
MNEASFEDLHVLAVEDEAFSQKFVQRVLAAIGIHRVTIAGNGVEALEILVGADPPVDLVISDIEMPEMNGFELARKIRWGAVPRYKDVPFLMLTGRDTEENVQKGRAYRIQGFIVKPPTPEILKDHIVRALERRTENP